METYTLDNVNFTVDQGFYVLESNKGNHSGHNRTWKQWNLRFETRKAAREAMAEIANDENQAKPGQRGYTRKTDNSAWVDGATYLVVNAKELVEAIKGTGTSFGSIHAITVIEAVEA